MSIPQEPPIFLMPATWGRHINILPSIIGNANAAPLCAEQPGPQSLLCCIIPLGSHFLFTPSIPPFHPPFSSLPYCNAALLKSAAVKQMLDWNVISVSHTARTLTCLPPDFPQWGGDWFEMVGGGVRWGWITGDRSSRDAGWVRGLDGRGVNCHLLRAFMGYREQADIQRHAGMGVGGQQEQ